MLVIWGTGNYGRVHIVPGHFHVETKFFNWMFIPVIPLGSHLVAEPQGRQFAPVEISLSLLSVLLAWVRAGLILAGLAGGVYALAQVDDVTLAGLAFGASVGAAAALAIATTHRAIAFASPDRALHLAREAGFGEDEMAGLRAALRLTPDYSEVHGFPVEPKSPAPESR